MQIVSVLPLLIQTYYLHYRHTLYFLNTIKLITIHLNANKYMHIFYLQLHKHIYMSVCLPIHPTIPLSEHMKLYLFSPQ